jgi:hypothetical protein
MRATGTRGPGLRGGVENWPSSRSVIPELVEDVDVFVGE